MNVEELVRKVLEEIKRQYAHKKQILLFIDDNKSIFEKLSADIEKIKLNGFPITAVTSPGMKEYVLGHGFFESVFESMETEALKGIIERSAVIGVPAINFSSLARVCMGVADSLVETAVATALEMGREIIFCINGCLPAYLSVNVNENYLRMVIGHLKTIVSYGCSMTACETFAQSLADAIETSRDCNSLARSDDTNTASEYPYLNQRVITKKDILAYKNSGGIIIPDMALITDEAKDYAVKEKISIMKKLT
ncbi:MAG: hypothetical protein ACOYU3_10865 [Bacillota bacterium]